RQAQRRVQRAPQPRLDDRRDGHHAVARTLGAVEAHARRRRRLGRRAVAPRERRDIARAAWAAAQRPHPRPLAALPRLGAPRGDAALSLAGFAVGAVVGTRLAPVVLPEGSRAPYAPLLGLAGALLLGGFLASGFGGAAERVRAAIRVPGFGLVDGVAGAALSAAIALGIARIGGAA